jgi:hypothetical protein
VIRVKKNTIIISILVAIFILIILLVGIKYGSKWLLSSQYNENGISHFLVVTIDKNQEKEYIGELDNHKIFIEHLNIKETNFRNIDAENVSIKEAINNRSVSIDEWKKYAWKRKKEGNVEILIFDNYEIACTNEDCIIRPKS